MFRKLLTISLLISALSLPASSSAGGAVKGTVSGTINIVTLVEDGIAYIVLNGAKSPNPDCNKDVWWHFAFDTTTPVGKEFYSTILAAKLAGKSLRVNGTGDCTAYANVENIHQIDFAQ